MRKPRTRVGNQRVKRRAVVRVAQYALRQCRRAHPPTPSGNACSSRSRAARATAGLAPPVPAVKRQLPSPHDGRRMEVAERDHILDVHQRARSTRATALASPLLPVQDQQSRSRGSLRCRSASADAAKAPCLQQQGRSTARPTKRPALAPPSLSQAKRRTARRPRPTNAIRVVAGSRQIGIMPRPRRRWRRALRLPPRR